MFCSFLFNLTKFALILVIIVNDHERVISKTVVWVFSTETYFLLTFHGAKVNGCIKMMAD